MKKGEFLSQYELYLANGHDYVEIAGIKWATMNVGAKKVTDHGLYFQWGDTKGYTTSDVGFGTRQKVFTLADYKHYRSNGTPISEITKYNVTDGKMVLDLPDDAVHANWGGGWRMPTKNEFATLGKAVTTAWTTDYQGSGVAGLVLTDKVDNSKVLFFPAAGFCNYGDAYYVGIIGYYWSSSLFNEAKLLTLGLNFGSFHVHWQYSHVRYLGLPVRGVIG